MHSPTHRDIPVARFAPSATIAGMPHGNEDPNFDKEKFDRDLKIAKDQVQRMIAEMTFNADIIATIKTGGGLPPPQGEFGKPVSEEFLGHIETIDTIVKGAVRPEDFDEADQYLDVLSAISDIPQTKQLRAAVAACRAAMEKEQSENAPHA